jgi:hypothetical protein
MWSSFNSHPTWQPRLAANIFNRWINLVPAILVYVVNLLFLPSLSTPPSFIKYYLPNEQRVEFMVGYLQGEINLHSLLRVLRA